MFRRSLFIFFVVFYFSSFSQDNKVFNMLFLAGVVPSQVHGDSYSGYRKAGAMLGLGIESKAGKNITSSIFFQFIQKGARKNQDVENNDLTAYYLNLNYVEVPLLITYSQKKYLFDLGISGAYLINYYEADQNMNFTGMFPFQKYDFSVKAGLGYHINSKWMVNFRTSNSFITTRPNRTKQAIYFNNIIARTFNKGYYNNVLEFTISYRLSLNKK